MSRIGNSPISLPDGVDVSVSGADVTVKGPKGSLSRTFSEHVSVSLDDGVLTVARDSEGCESHRSRRHPIRRVTRAGEIRVYCAVAGCDLTRPRCKGGES